METTLGRICSFYSGTGFPVEYQGKKAGEYPFYKVGDISKNVVSGNVELKLCDNYIDWEDVKNIHGTIVPAGTIVFAKIGEAVKLNRRAITSNDCLVDNNVIGVKPNIHLITLQYCYHFLSTIKMEKYAESTTVPSVKKSVLEKIPIFLPSIEEQNAICSELNKVSELISLRKKQLQKLDDLVKSRFVEMFGDPVHNTAQLPVHPMTEVCEIIDGDRGKNYPKQEDFFEEEYCLFLNAKNVTKNGFDFSECMFITEEKDAALRKGKLQRGDVVLTTRGTLGNLAFYMDEVPYDNMRINSGMVILRMKREVVNEVFFIEQFRMQIDDIKATVASGSAQPQLPISTMNKISMVIPDLKEQQSFAAFVARIDKSKLTVQQGLDKLELLKQSLMQKYFG